MLLTWAHAFSALQACLIDSEHSLLKQDPGSSVARNEQLYIRSNLNSGYESCEKLGLRLTIARIDRLRYKLDPFAQDKGTLPVPTVSDVRAKLRELYDTIYDELRTRFLCTCF